MESLRRNPDRKFVFAEMVNPSSLIFLSSGIYFWISGFSLGVKKSQSCFNG